MFPFALLAYLISFPFDKYNRLPNWILLKVGKLYLKINPYWKIKISGLHNYNRHKPVIFISNHQSFLDMPLQALMPWTFKWVSKKSLFYIPFMGWTMKLSGHISIDRDKKTAMRALDRMIPILKNNIPVIIFPEGTRSRDGELHKFKNGAFNIAIKNNIHLQPIVIDGTHNILPSDDWRFTMKQDIYMSILESIDPNDFDTMAELKKYAYSLMKDELYNIRNQHKAHQNV
jgi:1-acyl-sn-glycerol-3-phosphate acyltransferase